VTVVISTEVYVEHEDLALADTIGAVPESEIGVVSDAGTDPRHDVHFFWIEASDFEAVEEALAEDHTVAEFSAVVDEGDRRTYRIEYSDGAKLISPAITERGGLTLESRSHSNGWVLSLQLQDHEALHALDEYATEEEIRLDILELQQDVGPEDRSEFGLTESQVEALVCAYVHGYYDEPREISLEGIGSILGISETAVSGRLRRGSARLIEAVLGTEGPDGVPDRS
jgi:predicted DNA binding protein